MSVRQIFETVVPDVPEERETGFVAGAEIGMWALQCFGSKRTREDLPLHHV